MYDIDPVPLKYIDSLKQRQHIGLFYEDSEYAHMIEFRFIRNGLALGEKCAYVTEGDSGSIVLKMLSFGIPMKYFQTSQLKVHQIKNVPGGQKEIMENCKKDIAMILSGLTQPFRIVSRIIPDVSTSIGMSVEIELERTLHKCFDDFGGSIICPYDISKIESTRKKQWMEELQNNHHCIIYVPKFGEGGVFTFSGSEKSMQEIHNSFSEKK